MRTLRLAALLALACLLPAAPAAAQGFEVARIVSGLSNPVYVTAPPGDTSRIFIVEQRSGSTGRVRVFDLETGMLQATPYLSVSGLSTGSEQGLLGLAFHPDFESNGYLYVNYNEAASAGDTVVARYVEDPGGTSAGSPLEILRIDQPGTNHNGGWMDFGPDGYLWISSGDGGGGGADPSNHGQRLDTLLGKILRIDVDGDDFPGDPDRNYAIPPDNPFVGVSGEDEIYAYGLRNPYRCAFDRLTGDLIVGDVGENSREELDVIPAGVAGLNFGWRPREGTIATPGVGEPTPAGAIDPIYDYLHGGGDLQGNSVIAGPVYRGPIVGLQGRVLFADFFTSRLWTLVFDGSDPEDFDGTNYTGFVDLGDDPRWDPVNAGPISFVSSFGEDAAGNVYVAALTGDVYQIRSTAPAVPALAPLPAAGLAVLLTVAGAALSRRLRPTRG